MSSSWVLQPFSSWTETAGERLSDSITQRQLLAGLSFPSEGLDRQEKSSVAKKNKMKGKGDETRFSYWFALKDELLAYHCSCKWKLCQKGVASRGNQIKYIFFFPLCGGCAWLQKLTEARAEKQIKQNKCVLHRTHLSVWIHHTFNTHESAWL